MTLLFVAIGSLAFAGIGLRFAARFARKTSYPYPIK